LGFVGVTRVVAVDWSGAKAGSEKRIWLAEVFDGRVVRLEDGRSRAEVIDEVISIGLASRLSHEHLVVGLDFAFGFPMALANRMFADLHSRSLWRAVRDRGESWLAECEPPFWGRPGKPNPHGRREGPVGERSHDQFRATESALRAEGLSPKSVLQVGGAGSVGTGSVRGIPHLLTLAEAGFSIWPFDEASELTVFEIYPRIHTGPVVKSSELARKQYLAGWEVAKRDLPANVAVSAVKSDDAFDALISAVEIAAILRSGSDSRGGAHSTFDRTTLPPKAFIEGWVWTGRHRGS
jgi:hypothetical protein